MKINYVKASKLDPTIRDIYVLVLKEGWNIRVTSRHEGMVFVEIYDQYRKRPFILYPENRTVERGEHGCKLE